MTLLAAAEWDWMAIGIRIVHILAAVLAAGGAFFQRLALHPALAGFDDAERVRVREAVAERWRKIVFFAIAALLVTGFMTFLMYRIPEYKTHPDKGLYHGVLGVKILLALAAFHCATVLVLPGAKGMKYREKSGFWLNLLCGLMLLILIIGGVLRYFPA